MDPVLIEQTENGKKAYKSLLVEPKNLSVLNSETALDIIKELIREPGCAMDVARSLQEDEQKIYYYLRKLEAAGLVKLIRMERRHGMTANIYETTAPVVATKLHDDGHFIPDGKIAENTFLSRFLSPFLKNGQLNAKIILADPYPHGKYDEGCKGAAHTFDFALFLGRLTNGINFPTYKLDTETEENELKENIILFSNPRFNTITERINHLLPVFFDPKNGWAITSKITGKTYNDPRMGLILKWDNPFNKEKKILLLAGVRTRGMRAITIALTKYLDKVMEGIKEDGNLIRIVEGLDKGGKKIIDDVIFLE